MLSRRLQLPQSLTRRQKWQFPAASSPWQQQLSRFMSQTPSRTQSSPDSPRETETATATATATESSSEFKIRHLVYSSGSHPSKHRRVSRTVSTSKSDTQHSRPSFKAKHPGQKLMNWRGRRSSEVDDALRELMGDEIQAPSSKSQSSSSSSSSSFSSSSSSLLSEFASWIDGPPQDGVPSSPKEENNRDARGGNNRVLVLESASRYLTESDFYRLASQGRHVDGWTLGITKVIQARSPITLQPRGKYFLFFEDGASASKYLEKMSHLHAQLQKVAANGLIEKAINGSTREEEAENGGRGAEDKAAVEAEDKDKPVVVEAATELDDVDVPSLLKQYTLLPPGAPLNLESYSEEQFRAFFLGAQKRAGQARLMEQEGNSLAKDQSPVEDRFELNLPAEQNKVLIRLSRSKLTIYGLRWAIDADSKRRNLPWRLQFSQQQQPPSSSLSSSSSSSYSPIQPLEYSKKTVKHSRWNSPPGQHENDTTNFVEEQQDFHNPQQAGDLDNNTTNSNKNTYERNPLVPTTQEKDYYNAFKYPDQSWGEEKTWGWKEEWEEKLRRDDDDDEEQHNVADSSDGWENRGSPGGHDAKHNGYGSFVVSFVDVHEARRFAREWHRRRVWDYRTNRWITVDATWLW